MGDIADNWKELSGKNNWKGLLDPLDLNLRRYIIHCGQMVQANYDAFNGEKTTKMYGFVRYSPQVFFTEVGLENGNPYKYTVTNYFYARSDIDFLDWVVPDQSAWMGYVAVATDEGKAALGRRDIMISWRGTQLAAEWFKDFQFALTSASDILGRNIVDPKVHNGFYSLYTSSDAESTYNKSSARDQVLCAIRKLVDKYRDEEISITVTGHSLGSALATLNAADIIANGYNKPTESHIACMVTAVVFASPHIGDWGFKMVFDGFSNLHLLRIRNANDIVPGLPPIGYFDVGKELIVDTTKSPYQRTDFLPLFVPLFCHNLENYLHGVAGTQEKGKFELVIGRDISLLNKELDLLKREYGVPPKWWIVKNKSMIQLDNGFWKLEYYVPDPPNT